ncbi:MAG: excinuclease ABC subunit UvrC, partial [Campylobacter sp.]|nr:excinuclease ABC subunit UvrC [Campylobacter sp.]
MLIDEIKSLPNEPGVYQYFDDANRLLYVGKAKNLKNRVKSYFSFTKALAPSPKISPRIYKMISQTAHLEYIVTSSEADALILENSFIKQLKPKYNILLRDDKTYPYIYLNLDDEFPRFDITRKIVKGKNIKYFGPYFKGGRELLEALWLNFKLVQSKSALKAKGSYLLYQLGYCEAPLISQISPEQYAKVVNSAIAALQNPQSMLPNLTSLMTKYAQNENYEQAAKIRDKINVIKDLDVKVEVDLAKLEDFEVFAVHSSENLICAVRFSVQNGKISGVYQNITNAKTIVNIDVSDAYKQIILESFPIDQPIITAKIYTNEEFEDANLIEEILTQRHGKKFHISTPKIGEKRRICEIANKNAAIFIQNYLKTHDNDFLTELKEYFSLAHTPYAIEAFDNSHMFGKACVGAMVRFEHGNFIKEKYRHVHLNAKNDYDQMSQMLTERALRFDKLSPPDLWVIDGGETLLSLANEILKSSGANIDVIAISKEKIDAKAHRAKGAAKDKIYTQNAKFSLNTDDKKLQFFQRLRDESHRFAISFHQKTKR